MLNLEVRKVRQHLIDKEVGFVPSLYVIAKIMREQLNLHHVRTNFNVVCFSDPLLDEERQWVARLIAQLLNDQVEIVCIDESSFRYDLSSGKGW